MKSDINKVEKKKQLGRPHKAIDEKVLANLSQIGCTQEEIGSIESIAHKKSIQSLSEIVSTGKL